MKLYTVEMLRWGDEESHHYIIGVYDNLVKAQDAGQTEKMYRGCKYEYRIVECNLNEACK